MNTQPGSQPWLSVVLPMRNEAAIIERTLLSLQGLRGAGAEVIAVDGQSTDESLPLADPLTDQVLSTSPGRATQMQAGIDAARGELIWLLHADSQVDEAHLNALHKAQQAPWGFFAIRLSGQGRGLRIVERGMNWRSRLTGIATGDQGIFAQRRVLRQIGGVPQLPLMEDVSLSKALKRVASPAVLHPPLQTSSRRWEQRGVVRTVLEMWALRAAFSCGVSPARLAAYYQKKAPRG